MIRIPGHAGDVRYHVLQLQIHLRQRFLHVLDVGRRVVQQPLPLAQVGPQGRDIRRGMEAGPQQSVGMQLLEPLGVVDVGLPAGHVLDIPRVDHEHLQASRLQHLEQRDPIYLSGFHGYGLDTASH